MQLFQILDKYIFQGVVGNAAYDLLINFIRKILDKNVEELYLDSAKEIAEEIKPFWEGKYGDKVYLDADALRKILRYKLAINLEEVSLSELDQRHFVRRLARICANNREPFLIAGGHILTEDDYEHLITTFIDAVHRLWRRKITESQAAFQTVVLSEIQYGNAQIAEVSNILNLLKERFQISDLSLIELTALLKDQDRERRQEKINQLEEKLKDKSQELNTLRIKTLDTQQEVLELRKALQDQGYQPRNESFFFAQSYNLPREPVIFVERETYLEKIIEALDFKKNRGWGVGIDGIGGVGKTTMATMVAHHFMREATFRQIIWTTAQTQQFETSARSGRGFVEFEGLLDEIIKSQGYYDEALNYPLDGKRHLVERLIEKSEPCLLIIDNLETIANYEPIAEFLNQTLPLKAITTTRKQYSGRGETRIFVPPMEYAQIKLLVQKASESKKFDVSERQTKELFEVVGGIPLAILWCLGKYRDPVSIDNFMHRLRNINLAGTLEEQEKVMLNYCFREAFDSLSFEAKNILKFVSVFSDQIPESTVRELQSLSLTTYLNAIEELEAFSLAHSTPSREAHEDRFISILPLTRAFTRSEIFKDENSIEYFKAVRRQYAEYLSSFSLTENYIYAFTPDYKPIKLEKGATVLDFAYHVHTDIGHKFHDGIVNSQHANAEHIVNNGDIVEILTNTNPQINNTWLRIVKTERAYRSIRTWFRQPIRSIASTRQGNKYALQCKITDSEREYLKAISLDSTNTWAYNKLGHQSRLDGDNKSSIRAHGEVLKIDKLNPHAFQGLACNYYQQREFLRASMLYQKALNVRPKYVNALFGMARCYCALGKYEDAKEALDRGLLSSNLPLRRRASLHLLLMVADLGLKNLTSAIRHLETSLSQFNRLVPKQRLDNDPYYGTSTLYYYSIALSCANSKAYAPYLERALAVCGLTGQIKEILVDLDLLSMEMVIKLEKEIGRIYHGGSAVQEKIEKMRSTLEKKLAMLL